MPPDTAAPASPEPTNNAPAEVANPNDLATELSAEEEAAFVANELGVSAPVIAPDKADEPAPVQTDDPEEPATPEEPAAPAAPEAPAPAPAPEPEKPTNAAPEAVQTDDLWVELEDANGETFKIGVNDRIPDALVFKNDAQLAELMEARQEMKSTLAQRTTDFEASKQTAQEQEAATQAAAAQETEIQTLIDQGLLATPKAGPKDGKNYSPEEVKADPALQSIVDIFALQAAKNLPSFILAFSVYQQEQANNTKAEADRVEAENAKRRGAIVGGGSSSSSSGSAGPSYVQGSATNIYDVPVDV
jgi:hypothetical protein